jgi:hypothetical protein
MKVALPIAFFIALIPSLVAAKCHFRIEAAIVCTDPKNAAIAFNRFGYDVTKIEKTYNVEILHEAECGIPYKKTFKTDKIELSANGKVALPKGWAHVARIIVNNRDIYYIASEYIDGTCKKFTPETIQMNRPVLGGN